MKEDTPESQKLLPANNQELSEQDNQQGFLRRAFNRTKEAFRSVDEAITGRETFRRIDERFQHQQEFNDQLMARLTDALDQVAILGEGLDSEIGRLDGRLTEQQEFFTRISNEVTAAASEVRTTATAAEQALVNATNHQEELKKQASEHLTRWQHDAESLKNQVHLLQNQLSQLHQSFKQFVLIIAIVLGLLIGVFIYYIVFPH
ncbi:MAG: hypothetical protein AB1489_11855 [Acidobacteriota bacterium]